MKHVQCICSALMAFIDRKHKMSIYKVLLGSEMNFHFILYNVLRKELCVLCVYISSSLGEGI